MLKTTLVGLVLASAVAFAGPAPRAEVSLDRFLTGVSETTGYTVERVREDAVEALRLSDEISAAELVRIGRGEPLSNESESLVVSLLSKSREFRTLQRIDAKTLRDLREDAGEAFSALRETRATPLKLPGNLPVQAWHAYSYEMGDPSQLVGKTVLVDLGQGVVLATVSKAPGVYPLSDRPSGPRDYAFDGDLFVKIGRKQFKVVGRGSSEFETPVRVQPNSFARDNEVPEGLLAVGDKFTSRSLGRGTRWIVEATEMSGGGSAQGGDIYPDGWGVWARNLKTGRVVFFRQSGAFNNLIEDVKKVR